MGANRKLTEDDRSLLAMEAGRMSIDSIAATMGWSRRRVETRLALIKAPAEPEAPVAEPVRAIGDIAAHVSEAQRRRLPDGLRALVEQLPAVAGVVAARGLRRLVDDLPELWSILAIGGLAALTEGLGALPLPEPAPLPPPPPVSPPAGNGTPWTDGENALLRRLWPITPRGHADRLPREFKRTLDAIRSQAGKLDLGRMGAGAPPPPLRSEKFRPRIAVPVPAKADPFAVQALKPLTEGRLRYCGWFHAAGWPVEEIAWLFDAPEGDLAQALGALQ